MKKQIFLKSCLVNVLSRLTSIMTDKGFNLFDECAARCVDLSLGKKSTPFLPEKTVKCTHLAA